MAPKEAIFRVGKTDEDIGSYAVTVLYREDQEAEMSFSTGAIFEVFGKQLKQGTLVRVTVELVEDK